MTDTAFTRPHPEAVEAKSQTLRIGRRPSRFRACGGTIVFAALAGAALVSGCGSSSHSATSTPATTLAASTSSARGVLSCPSASAISAATGATYPAPQEGGGASGTLCNYSGANTPSGDNVQIILSKGISASEIKALATNQGGVSGVSPVSGLGDVAYLDTGTPGISSELFVLDGTEGIEVMIVGSPTQLEAVGRAVLAG